QAEVEFGGAWIPARGELPTDQVRLVLDVEPREQEGDLVTESAEARHRDLGARGRGLPAHARDPYAVRPLAVENRRVQARDHVGAAVAGARDLVQQLRGLGADGHSFPGARELCYHRTAV